MPKSLRDPQWWATGLLAALLALSIWLVQGAKADSERASLKADAAHHEAEAVASDLKAHVSGQEKQDAALLRQLTRIEAHLVRIEARLTALGHVSEFDLIPAPPFVGIHSTGYDTDRGCLYVRYLVDGTREPGSIYRYAGVLPGEYLDLIDDPEPLDWIWDNLRMRGTVSGHTRDYELVGIGLGGVPRKATLRGGSEWYVPRTVLSESGEWITSELPEEKIEDNQ